MADQETARLRFTGAQPLHFAATGAGMVEPGGEFTVAAADAGRFLGRPDVELASDGDATPAAGGAAPVPRRRGLAVDG